VDGIKGFGLSACHLDALLRNDAKSRLFNDGVDGAGQIARGRVRLDNRKGALNRNDLSLNNSVGKVPALIAASLPDSKRPDEAKSSPTTGLGGSRDISASQYYHDFIDMNAV
jgi:hypothetical protein